MTPPDILRQHTPQQRSRIRDLRREFKNLPNDTQRRIRRAYRHFKSLPEPRRKALRQQWEKAARPRDRGDGG